MNWLKNLFNNECAVKILPRDFCDGKSNQELVKSLESNKISMCSGQRIVTELLKRLTKAE